jgi:hypothetical protein
MLNGQLRRLARLPLLISLAVAVVGTPHCTAAQTQAWRIGVGGDLPTGFLGALSIYGLPHETILDQEMLSAKGLERFQIVFLARPSYGTAEVSAAVEEYVRNGGCAVCEYPVMPTDAMIAGRRIGPQKGPDMVYVPGDPVTAGLTDAVLPTGRAGNTNLVSIIPSDPKVRVLARYTDKGAKPELQKKFVDGAKGSPAILMTKYGKGTLVWSGERLSISAAFDDNRNIAPFIANLVRELSGGEVVPRFTTLTDAMGELLTEPRHHECSLARFTPDGKSEAPAGADVLDDDADAVDQYNLYGKVASGAQATVYLAYHNADWYRAVRFDAGAVSIVRVDDGKPTVLRSVPRPPARGWMNVMVRRHWGRVSVSADGAPLVSASDGSALRGVVAAQGLLDPGYQPVAPADFTDGFTRTAEETDPWQRVSGTWQMVQTEGEPSEAANPFRYQGIAADPKTPAIVTTGSWAWDDYSVEAAVFADSAACGIIAHYQNPDRFSLLRLTTPVSGKGSLALVERSPGGERELVSAPVGCERRRWYRLGLRITSGVIEGVVDGEVVVKIGERRASSGAVGMYVADGKAQFDDVAVTAWHGLVRPASGWGPWEWAAEGGTWSYDPGQGAGGSLVARASGEAKALTVEDGFADGRFEAEVRADAGGEVGLVGRACGKDDAVIASLSRDAAGKLSACLSRQSGTERRVLAIAPVAADPAAAHRLSVTGVGRTFAVGVDGQALLQAETDAAEYGRIGLYVRGGGTFRDWSFVPVVAGEDVNDTPTPDYAGIIDRNSWAGRAGAWQADPTALDAFWHTGFFPHDVQFRLGVYRDTAPVTRASAALSPDRKADLGYVLTASCNWGKGVVDMLLTRDGVKVATGTALLPAGASNLCLSFRRDGALIGAGIDDRRVIVFHDEQPVRAPYLGFRVQGGALVRPDETRVSSTDLRNHTFDAAPTEWFIHSGAWELTSRWPCTPGWAWFSGVSKKDALIRTKSEFIGDQEVQFYAGAKALPSGEAMRDIVVGLCGSEDPTKGYRFVVESASGGTFLMKDGQTVARAEGFILSQAAIHFDWSSFAVRKEGNRLTLKWWGRTILQYDDPAPLEGGYVWLGTYNNGISIPRVTIYGRQR